MAGRARLPFDKLQSKAGFTEAIDVVEEIKCTNAQLMDLASLREAVKLHTLDLRCMTVPLLLLTWRSFNSFHILRNIEGILDAPALRHLTLSGSPVSKMPNYRSYVVAKLPLLQTLDGKVVTLEERQHAQRLYPDLVTVPPLENNFVTPITAAEPPAASVPATSPAKSATPSTPAKPKITHTELSAMFSSDSATLSGAQTPTPPVKSPSDFDSLFSMSSPAKPPPSATPSASAPPSSSSVLATPPASTTSASKLPTSPSPLDTDLFSLQSSTKSVTNDIFGSQSAKQKKVDALEKFFSSPLPAGPAQAQETVSKVPSPFPEKEESDDDATPAPPLPTFSDPEIAAAVADMPNYYIGCPGKHPVIFFSFFDPPSQFCLRLAQRKPIVFEGKESDADTCVTCDKRMGLLILKGQFDLSVAVLMGKAMASHPQGIVSFSSSFRFPLTLTPPPAVVAKNRDTTEEDAKSETADSAPTAASTAASDPSPASSSDASASSASNSATPSAASLSAPSPSPSYPQTIDSSAWLALADEAKLALALEAFLSEWQGCAWAGDARFEMTHATVPPVVVSISPIDVQVIPESPTLKYMVTVKTPLEWMVAKDAPLPETVHVTEAEKGDWKRFLAAFDFSKKAFVAAQASLKRREEEKSGLVKEREDVELCFALLTHSYFRSSRWTGSVRLRIHLKSEGGQDITRTVVIPTPKTTNPKVVVLPNWDTLVAPLLATMTLSSDAWFEMAQAKNTILNMLFDKRIQTDNIAGLIKFANSFTFGEKRYAAFVSHYRNREGKLEDAETSQILTAADEHTIGEWLVKKGMDSSLYLYEKLSQPANSQNSPAASASHSPTPAHPMPAAASSPALPSSPPAVVSVMSSPALAEADRAPAAAAPQQPKQPAPTSALRDLDKCVDELLQIATEKQGHTEAEQAALIEKLKAYIDAQKRQGEL